MAEESMNQEFRLRKIDETINYFKEEIKQLFAQQDTQKSLQGLH